MNAKRILAVLCLAAAAALLHLPAAQASESLERQRAEMAQVRAEMQKSLAIHRKEMVRIRLQVAADLQVTLKEMAEDRKR